MKYFLSVLLLSIVSFCANAGFIDLSTWTASGDGVWTVSNDKVTVEQSTNGHSRFFLSGDEYLDVTFSGTMGVKSRSDDDWIGIAFGYSSIEDFYLFDWKQEEQSSSVATYQEGYTLMQITGSHVSLHAHKGRDTVILSQNYGDGLGWADSTIYDFSLLYSSNRITLTIDNLVFFDVAGAFEAGQFGFYANSQPNAEFGNLSISSLITKTSTLNTASTPVPAPTGLGLLVACGLIIVGKRKKQH